MKELDKVSLISFVACVTVVVLHACQKCGCGDWLFNLFTQWTVPWFLIVSGWFYAVTLRKYSLAVVARKKMLSLIIPYMIWGAFGFVMASVSKSFSSDASWSQILGLSRSPVYNQPLWFVRQLVFSMMVLTLAVKGFASVWNKRLFLTMVGISYSAFFLVCIFLHLGFVVEMPASPFYFLLGYLLSLSGVKVPKLLMDYRIRIGLTSALVACSIAMRYATSDITGGLSVASRNGADVLTISAFWLFVSHTAIKLPRLVALLSNFSFFIYCFHMPVLRALPKIDIVAWGGGGANDV